MKKNTGVIGCGWFGQSHSRVYSEISNLVAVCDINERNAKIVADKYGVNWYTDPKDMLKEQLDAVSIVIPPDQIPDIANLCVSKGVSTLLEKPIATNIEKIKRILEYDESVRIMPGFIELFNPVFDVFKEKIQNIGKPIMANTRRIGPSPRRFWNIGVIMDLAFHDLYLLKNIFNFLEIIESVKIKITDEQFEDAAVIILDLGENIRGITEANWITPTRERTLRVYGDEATIETNFVTQEVTITHKYDVDNNKLVNYKPKYSIEPLKRELNEFLYSKHNPIPLSEGIDILEITLKATNMK